MVMYQQVSLLVPLWVESLQCHIRIMFWDMVLLTISVMISVWFQKRSFTYERYYFGRWFGLAPVADY